ncbi:MAG: hypothetical protein ACJ71B_03935 [Nitrososphaera sp.]
MDQFTTPAITPQTAATTTNTFDALSLIDHDRFLALARRLEQLI